MESPTPPPLTSFADTSTPVTSPPVSPWCSEQTPENMRRNLNYPPKRKDWPEWNNICYTWSLCEKLRNLCCILGCSVVTVELQFIIWSHNFMWLLEISNSKNFQILDKKTRNNTMNKITLYKVIHNLQLMSHLWIVQKTELTTKPKLNSSWKKLILKNGSKTCLANKTFYGLDAIVQNE